MPSSPPDTATDTPTDTPTDTTAPAYAQRLQRLSRRGGLLRRVIDPQRPYRWNLRRLQPGFVLDIGCGIGRNLRHIDGHGVGVDHNVECVATCTAMGLTAYTSDEFPSSPFATPGRYDSVLFAHVLEHMTAAEAAELVTANLQYLRDDGRVIVITPQQRGQDSDATHVELVDDDAVRRLATATGLHVDSIDSFPFPRVAGRWFTYNETVAVLSRAARG